MPRKGQSVAENRGQARGKTADKRVNPGEGRAARVERLEAELADARRTITALIQKARPGDAEVNGDVAVSEAAARLEELIADRTHQLEEQTIALEAANTELRNLTTNLDQIVRQRTRALAESETQLRRKNVELDRLNRLKTEFISIAAHELRTPMTSIVGYLDLIVEGRLGTLPGDLKRPISSLRRNAHRLKRLIEDMLDVSRLEAGRVTLARKPTALADIVSSVVYELKPLADEKSQKVSTHIEDVPLVDGDADKVHQVISNLVANSIKYTPAGGEIRISVDAEPRVPGGERPRVRLRVWDNGIGIPSSVRTRIFEPFSDVHAAKHHTSVGPDSAGLGLYIARGIVELHGGAITVDSEEGRYTEFTVLLPPASGDQPG